MDWIWFSWGQSGTSGRREISCQGNYFLRIEGVIDLISIIPNYTDCVENTCGCIIWPHLWVIWSPFWTNQLFLTISEMDHWFDQRVTSYWRMVWHCRCNFDPIFSLIWSLFWTNQLFLMISLLYWYRRRHLYLHKYENVYLFVCLSVCLLRFFSAISKPIGIPFGTKFLLDPEWVLKQ